MPGTMETTPARSPIGDSDEATLPPTAEDDALVNQNFSESAIDEKLPSFALPAEEFAKEQREVSLLDPINNVVDRVRVWWNGKGISAAEARLQGFQEQSQALEGKLDALQKGIANSSEVENAIRAARERTGLSLQTDRFNVIERNGRSAQAREQEQVLKDSLDVLHTKISAVSEKKKAFEAAREGARGRIVERFQAKVDQHQGWIDGFDERIGVTTSEIESKSQQLALFIEERASLEAMLAVGELLPGDAKELQWSIDQIRLNEHRVEMDRKKSMEQKEKLFQQREVVVAEQLRWKEKISPSTREVSTNTQGPDLVVENGQQTVLDVISPSTPSEYVAVPPTSESVQEQDNQSAREKKEKNPVVKKAGELFVGLKNGYLEAEEEDQDDFTKLLRMKELGYAHDHPEKSNFYTFFIELLKLFSSSGESLDSQKKKTPS